MRAGDRLRVLVDRPAAGGRMIARHEGTIVLVSGAIPGESVEAVVEQVRRGTGWARTLRVLDPSPDRVSGSGDWACGGSVFAHIDYRRQLSLKREIIVDALTRIGRTAAPGEMIVSGSPVDGYRMRARLHLRQGRIGFFREGTHELCDPASTRQLLPATAEAMRELEGAIRGAALEGVAEVDIAENCSADQRAVHLGLTPGSDPSRVGTMASVPGLSGLACGSLEGGRSMTLRGSPHVSDEVAVTAVARTYAVTLVRHVRSFFQGNRFLLAPLLSAVVDSVPAGRALDLYAGVGLFAVSIAARGDTEVTAIEGDRLAASDLKANAERLDDRVVVCHQPVETFLSSGARPRFETVIVDPPRTGMSREAMHGVLSLSAPRIVYVSCDVATFGRDTRRLLDAGYRLIALNAFDLFPHSAHVEVLAVFDR